MRYEKVIKREDKSQVKIVITLAFERLRQDYEYRVDVEYKLPRKRTWVGFDTDDYTWRSLGWQSEERKVYELAWQLKYVTEEEIQKAKLECWERIKP